MRGRSRVRVAVIAIFRWHFECVVRSDSDMRTLFVLLFGVERRELCDVLLFRKPFSKDVMLCSQSITTNFKSSRAFTLPTFFVHRHLVVVNSNISYTLLLSLNAIYTTPSCQSCLLS